MSYSAKTKRDGQTDGQTDRWMDGGHYNISRPGHSARREIKIAYGSSLILYSSSGKQTLEDIKIHIRRHIKTNVRTNIRITWKVKVIILGTSLPTLRVVHMFSVGHHRNDWRSSPGQILRFHAPRVFWMRMLTLMSQ